MMIGDPVSPTAPTFIALHRRLTTAHRRIRELEAREADLIGLLKDVALQRLTQQAKDRHVVPIAIERW
jgi:hypothetical protein